MNSLLSANVKNNRSTLIGWEGQDRAIYNWSRALPGQLSCAIRNQLVASNGSRAQ